MYWEVVRNQSLGFQITPTNLAPEPLPHHGQSQVGVVKLIFMYFAVHLQK